VCTNTHQQFHANAIPDRFQSRCFIMVKIYSAYKSWPPDI
jgi:hypothetical protein